MQRITISILFFLVSAPSFADPSFVNLPLYFDTGPAAKRSLTTETQEELRDLIHFRIFELEEQLADPDEAHGERAAAVAAERGRLLALRRFKACLAGAFCGIAGGGLAFMGMNELMQIAPPGGGAVSIPQWLLPLMVGGNFGFMTGAVGYGWVSAQMPEVAYPQSVTLNERSKEILKAAEDLSAQMRSMAVPMMFWSIRRFKDFVLRYVAFMSLERLLLETEIEAGSEFAVALQATGLSSRFQDKDWSQDEGEMRLKLIKEKAVRQLRKLELETLKVMKRGLENPKHPMLDLNIDFEKLSFKRCMAILKYLMSDQMGTPDPMDELFKRHL